MRRKRAGALIAAWRQIQPANWYDPHEVTLRGPRAGLPSGQDRFHSSTHRHRLAATGNGWGGTRTLGMEIDAWMRHTNRWQQTPKGPILAWWYAPDLAQFEGIRLKMLEPRCFGALPVWKTDSPGPRYEWPESHGGGGVLLIKTHHTSWKSGQGVEPHLIAFDENPIEDQFKEAGLRSRGDPPTRIIGKMTQTEGITWMKEAVYEPWLRAHRAKHIFDEEEMMLAQVHPDFWLWPRGGIHDNANLSDADVDYYIRFIEQVSRSKNEKRVRLYGGFLSFVGDPVFDEDAIERMLAAAAAFTPAIDDGSFVALTDAEVDAMGRAEAEARGQPAPAARF